MRAVRCHEWMPYQDLKLEEVPSPPLGAGQVRIAVHYAGVSFATMLVTTGRYQRRPPRPFSPGTEVAGVVTEVAPGVTQVAVGDRVCAVIDWGGHAEEVVTDPATVFKLPDSVPLAVAPQLPTSYGTAFTALDWRARLQPGETLLVHGAAGAVGLAAVELGKAMGARVIATASTAEKLAAARAHGADAAVLFPSDTALEAIKAAAPNGADVVFDPVGGDAFDLSLKAVAQGGRILIIGFAAGHIQQIPANILLVKNVSAMGFNYGRYIGWGLVDERHRHEPAVRAALATMFRWIEEGKLRPTTSHQFPLTDYVAAMDAVKSRQGIGKVVLRMPAADA
ncbi:NADPH:quinone oxidoreductase family protein [Rhodopila sp.]|jgi:NADPH2:quinone reductase|uniref:NADPH:quinone oxidoreductase family protein n=1 Tax=Rhodopila sp. TaxID=2480087 RepID=UPI002B570FB5|nr:NADPH:quinone oxidoreductase family protein [Rhodopila sp.]HVZ07532.1 NADPH:quinone oxidoreductase family protein [Rhodopila sp.]